MTVYSAGPNSYNPEFSVHDSAPAKFLKHFLFLLSEDILHGARRGEKVDEIAVNRLEQLGNLTLRWIPTPSEAITFVNNLSTERHFLFVAFTVSTLFTITFIFYPTDTLQALKNYHDFLNQKIPSTEILQYWGHKAFLLVALCYFARAAGRMGNEELMREFYKNNLA